MDDVEPAVEIERRFLVRSDAWRKEATGAAPIRQVYVAVTDRCQVRVRRYGSAAYVTVKGKRRGLTRTEIETEVPPEFADQIIASGLYTLPPILKTRHLVPCEGFTFEIDEYEGDNAGLVVAEIELETEDADFPRPSWLGREITKDRKYRNMYLAAHPYSQW